MRVFCPMTLESRDSSLLRMTISEGLVLAPRLFKCRTVSGKAAYKSFLWGKMLRHEGFCPTALG